MAARIDEEGEAERHPDPIGIIGVGLLGSVIVDRLVAEGHAVIGYDRGEPRTDRAHLVPTAREVCESCQTVFLSLPHSGIVDHVLSEIESGLSADHVIIDTTTGDPEDALKHELALKSAAAGFIEATIAGSSDLLRQREAGIFLGGEAQVIAKAQPLLDLLTKRCFLMGGVGAASRFKLVFNLVLGLHRAVLAEALHLGTALGFEPTLTLDVLQASPAASLVMETKGEKMVSSHYEPPQARLSQHLKDVRLMLAEAERAGIRLPLSESHRRLLEDAETLGFGTSDTAAVMETYRHQKAR